jgi:hypothetical protein
MGYCMSVRCLWCELQDVGNTPVDPAYANITHRTSDKKWAIPWLEDDPGLTAPELWVNRTMVHCQEAVSYGVGGLMLIHWRARLLQYFVFVM